MYKRYESYKDSGVEWIGEIPGHWSISKIKYEAKINNQVLSETTPEDYGLKYLDIGNVGSDGKVIKIERMIFRDAPSRARRIVSDGDTLVSTVRTYLKAITWFHKADNNLICSTGFAVLSPKKTIEPKYLSYVMRSSLYVEVIVSRSVGVSYPAISSLEIGRIELLMPPSNTNHSNEQLAIVNFLDHKISEIDSLIADKEKLIKRLEEYKQSIITEAVTKGLNPDVKMKDSGVKWIGEIPEHWKHIKVKRIVSTPITDGPHETPVLVDKGIPFVSAEAIKNNKVDFDYVRGFISEDEHIRFSKKCKPQLNDIFIVKSGATTGKIALVETDLEFSIWSPLALVRCETSKAHYKFIFYYLQSIVFQRQIQLYWNYGTQQNIGMATLENLYVTLPSLDEQNNITAYLDRKLCELEGVIITVLSHINKLNSYRQSIIYEAVTGKIDVRDYQSERSEQLA